MTGTFIRRGNLDTDIRDACAQRRDHEKTQQECVKERGLRRKQTCWHLDLEFLAFRTVRKSFSVV